MKLVVAPSMIVLLLGTAGCGSRNEEYIEGAEPLRTESDRPSRARPTKGSEPSSPRGANPHAPVDPHAGTGAAQVRAPNAPSATPGAPTAGGVRWEVPDAFVTERPASSMRAAQYRVPRASGDDQDAQITVFYFGPGQGGAVQDNIDRWVGQVTQPDGRPSSEVARTDRRTVNGMQVTTVTVEGRLGGGGMPGMPPTPSIENGQLLGAIVEGPNGPVFFKMTGPTATVTAARGAFDELIGSFRAAE